MDVRDFIEECRAKNVPITVVDAPPIAIDPKATTAELLREEEALYWHVASVEAEFGAESNEAEFTRRSVLPEKIALHTELQRRHNAAKFSSSTPPWPDNPPDKRDEWDEVKRRTDIQDLAARTLAPYQHVEPRRVRDAVWWSCWNHPDRTPSLAVYDDGHFHCFACHAHGDCIDLARGALQLSSFQATMAVLSEWAGINARTIAIEKDGETIEVKR